MKPHLYHCLQVGTPLVLLMELKSAVLQQFPLYWGNPVHFEPIWKQCIEAVQQACKCLWLGNTENDLATPVTGTLSDVTRVWSDVNLSISKEEGRSVRVLTSDESLAQILEKEKKERKGRGS